jgi:hypothetical protein
VCEDGSYFILNYLYTHGDGESENYIQECYMSVFLLQEECSEHLQGFKIMEMEFMLFAFTLKADIENIPENLQMVLSVFGVALI